MQQENKKKRSFLQGLSTSSCVKGYYGLLAVIPATVVLILISFLPALLNIVLSFTDYNGDLSNFSFVGISNYADFFLLFGGDVLDAILNTFYYMLLTILPIQVVALIAALLVNADIRFKSLFRAIFFLPSILGTTVVCTTWGIMFDPLDGPLAQVLEWLHSFLPFIPGSSAFLGSGDTAMLCVALVTVWASFGFSMAIYLAGLVGISNDYYEVAKLEGANAWTVFFRITLPLLWPSVTICLFLAMQGTIGMSDYIILLTGGGRNTTTIGFYMYNIVMSHSASHGQAAAVSMYFFVFTSVIMLLFNKLINRKEVEM